ncbi:MAG: secretin N-terminal domain-containing protein [Candidatus Omnitrophota bacterium]
MKKKLCNTILVMIFSMYSLGPAFAQDALAGGQDDAVAATKTTAQGNVTMDFKEADITNVLRILSYKGGVNIVAGPEVTGLITIRLTDVPWEKALSVILRTYGFAYEKEENIIRVTTIESLKQEELTTEVYSLNYAKSEEVAESINEMLTDRGKIKFDERTNVVIVTDIPTNLYKISQIVEKLDKRTPQVLIEAKIIEVSLDDSERLGIDWTTRITASGSARPTKLPFLETWWREGAMIYPPNASTRAITIDDNGNQEIAITSNFMTDPFPPLSAAQTQAMKLSAFPMAQSTDFTYGTLDFTELQAVLEFINERTDTDVLSNPRIVTLNNKEAHILVGEKMLFPSFAFNEDTGDLVITGFDDQKDLGVKLTVVPHVNAEGDIVIELSPQIDEFVSIQVLDATRGIVAPIFTTREANAEVMLRDGDTIMMAGLITNTTSDIEDKVPILGDIPLLGDYLFKWSSKTVDRTELIIFITVHLMEDKWPTHLDPNISTTHMPVPRDPEVFMAIPRPPKEEKKRKWWKIW